MLATPFLGVGPPCLPVRPTAYPLHWRRCRRADRGRLQVPQPQRRVQLRVRQVVRRLTLPAPNNRLGSLSFPGRPASSNCTLRRGPYLRTLPASQLQAHCWWHNALAGMKQQPAQRTSTHNALARPVAPPVAKATLPLLRNSTPHAAGTPPHLGPSVLLFLACCSCLSLCCLAGFLYLGVCVSRLAVGAWFLYPAKRRHGVLATLPIRSAFCFVCLLVLH